MAAVGHGLRARVQEKSQQGKDPHVKTGAAAKTRARLTLTFFAATDPLECEPLRLWLADGSTRAYAIVGGAPGAGFGGRGRR